MRTMFRLRGFFLPTVSLQLSRKTSYLFIAYFLLRHFLAVFLAGLEGSGIDGVQALRPLPVEGALLLFAAAKTKIHDWGTNCDDVDNYFRGVTLKDEITSGISKADTATLTGVSLLPPPPGGLEHPGSTRS